MYGTGSQALMITIVIVLGMITIFTSLSLNRRNKRGVEIYSFIRGHLDRHTKTYLYQRGGYERVISELTLKTRAKFNLTPGMAHKAVLKALRREKSWFISKFNNQRPPANRHQGGNEGRCCSIPSPLSDTK